MWSNLPLFPPQASTFAAQVDGLYAFLVVVSVVFGGLIVCLLVYFAVKYRRRTELEQPVLIHGDVRLELLWTLIPLALTMTMFAWGASLYVTMSSPPEAALKIHVVGKQWMWKFQHPEGPREINELHVPAGQPVQLVMTSEDVIHSVYVPPSVSRWMRCRDGIRRHGLKRPKPARFICSVPSIAARAMRG